MNKYIGIVLIVCMVIIGCTQQERAKNFGGKATISLDKGKKLITVTWKDDYMWYLTRPMRTDESPEEYEFKEQSSYGILEGTVVIKESK